MCCPGRRAGVFITFPRVLQTTTVDPLVSMIVWRNATRETLVTAEASRHPEPPPAAPGYAIIAGRGEVAERLKALVSKTSMGAISSWVRIPPSPELGGRPGSDEERTASAPTTGTNRTPAQVAPCIHAQRFQGTLQQFEAPGDRFVDSRERC